MPLDAALLRVLGWGDGTPDAKVAKSCKPMPRGSKPGEHRGGRKRGTPNHATVEVRDIARRFIERPAYVEALQARLDAGTAVAMEQLLWQYGHGKPTELRDGSTLPARIIIEF